MRFPLIVLSLATVGLAGCATSTGDTTQIETGDDFFEVEGEPGTRNGETTAAVDETYSFLNEGDRDHTVTVHRPPDPADEYLIDEELEPGQSTTFTFDAPGTYHLYCRFHGDFTSGMRLTVEVA